MLKLDFGCRFADLTSAKIAFGARAIYRNGTLDFLSDRGGIDGDPTLAKELMGKLPEFVQGVKDANLDPTRSDVFLFNAEGYRGWASPQGSHGYMYLTLIRQ